MKYYSPQRTMILLLMEWSMLPYSVSNQCPSIPTELNSLYSLSWDVEQNSALVQDLRRLFDSCKFGNENTITDMRLCFHHCSLRRQCFAVELGHQMKTCRFCIQSQHGSVSIDNVISNITYVKNTSLQGKSISHLQLNHTVLL